ncbi:hypothetical protein C8Q79DRAFT_1008300 [Trametes meyenii]|nr:hypothetical protein C8Q79DRAFT_1008300 [Trametes meyenii]
MDYAAQNSMLGMLAALRAARRQPSNHTAPGSADGEPDGLVGILQNEAFLSGILHDGEAVPSGSEDSDSTDDLPPLEDDTGEAGSRMTRALDAPSASANGEGYEGLPVLDAIASPQSGITSSSPSANMQPRAPSEGTPVPSPHTDSSPEHNEDGAESDGSLPTLQTVSDSEDEGDSYFDSDPDWDESDDFDSMADSDDDRRGIPNSAPALVPDLAPASAPTLEPRNPRPEPPPPRVIDLLQRESDQRPVNLEDTFQSYRDLLERARSTLPNFPLEDLMQRLEHAENDPGRADILLEGLEIVPESLVRRYELLRMADGDDGDGCAICRDDLIDKTPVPTETAEILSIYAALPFHPSANPIVAFACSGKHLFHSDCIWPWLAQKTTCPSCRFDIDPYSLTHRRNRGQNSLVRPAWRPPQVQPMSDWLDAEERARASGVLRERVEVVMPRYFTPNSSGNGPLLNSTARAMSGLPTRASPLPASLTELLDATPHPEWGIDTEIGDSDLAAAQYDVEEMHRRALDAEARLLRLESYLYDELLPAGQEAPQHPARPPSAPPAVPSETSPSSLTPPSPSPPLPLSLRYPSVFTRPSQGYGTDPDASTYTERFRTLQADRQARARIAYVEVPREVSILPEHAENLREQARASLAHREPYTVSMPMPPLPTPRFPNIASRQERAEFLRQHLAILERARREQGMSVGMSFDDFETDLGSLQRFAPTAPTLTSSTPIRAVPNPSLMPISPAPLGPGRSASEVDTDHDAAHPAPSFDSTEIPPPIQADPHQALPAMAPLANHMRTLLNSSSLVGLGSGDGPPQSDWVDTLD